MQRYIVSQSRTTVSRGILARRSLKDLDILLAQYMRALVILGLAASVTYGVFFSNSGRALRRLAGGAGISPGIHSHAGSHRVLGDYSAGGGLQRITVTCGDCGVPGRLPHLPKDYVLSPQLMSAGMELHPLLVVFGVFAGEQIAGIPGAFSPCR